MAARPDRDEVGPPLTEDELERIRRAYSARDARAYDPYRWDNPGYVLYMQSVERAVLRALRDLRIRVKDARVLDVGCGSGYFLHRFREYGAGVCSGIDLMEDRIAVGRERYTTLDLRVGSATQLPFEDGAFDLVTQFTCLSSITDEDVRLEAAREMTRVAAGGWLLSFDLRGRPAPALRHPRQVGATPTAALDAPELRRLFGEPALIRREALAFELAQRTGRRALVSRLLGALPPLRSHLLGIWPVRQSER